MAWCEIYVFGCGYECSMVMGKCLAVSLTNCGCFRVVERCLGLWAKVSDELIARTAAWVLAAAPIPDKDWDESSLFISSNFKHQLSFARQEHMPFVINRAHLCFLQKKFAFMINLLSSTCLCFPFLCSCFCYSVSGTAKRGEFFFG